MCSLNQEGQATCGFEHLQQAGVAIHSRDPLMNLFRPCE
jgi:hypothetical protein